MGGTGSKQEDQIITAAIERAAGAKLTYVPFKGGGDVAAQLAGGQIDLSVNNPIEAVTHWQAGELRPLCVFAAERMGFKELIADGKSWADIPTCTEAGLPVEYQMMRGIFITADVSPRSRSPTIRACWKRCAGRTNGKIFWRKVPLWTTTGPATSLTPGSPGRLTCTGD